MKLWKDEMPHALAGEEFEPYLTPWLCEGAKTAIVVCPGGAYGDRCSYEGDDVGAWLNSVGISAFVLEYRVNPYRAPAAPSDVQRAIRLVRYMAADHGITHVGVMGFSAGGHLAVTASVHYDHPFYPPMDDVDCLSARPDFSVLCYSVVDMGQYRHDWSRRFLLGDEPTEQEIAFYSLQTQVTAQTPPAFLWHTAEDASVPAENTLLYAMALSAHKVPYEMHLFPHGPHGMALAQETPYVGRWKDMLLQWLRQMQFV